jgi:uncharacterized protein (UPF0147 family)
MVVVCMAEVANESLKEVAELLGRIISDRTVPRNIRSAAESAIDVLNGDGSRELKISTAIQTLDDIINDPNMPMYTRTQIWNIVSMLEQLRER